ncbi:MAG: hypothetical protein ACO1OB_09890 [Archangium sp.]
MRTFGLLVALTFALPASAKCMSSYWEVWPVAGLTIPTNARVIIGAYGVATAEIPKLASYGPSLVSSGHRVALNVVQTNVGEMKLSQVVLTPAEPLKPGAHYKLAWKKTPPGFTQPANWDVAKAADTSAPGWKSAPVSLAGAYEELGCGPAVNALVKVEPDDEATLVRARVVRPEGTVEYLLPWKSGERLAIGHGMCGGPFKLTDEVWKLELSVVDVAGNETAAPGGAMSFKGFEPVQ